MGDAEEKAREKAREAAEKALETSPEDSEGSLFAKLLKKSLDASAYERIDGYVSRPEGRSEEDVRVEAKTFATGIPGPVRGKLVDRLVEGAKDRWKKAARQRAQGKTDLAERTEAQARNLEAAADELNKTLPNALRRKVVMTP